MRYRISILTAASVAMKVQGLFSAPSTHPDKPNILLINIDDLGYMDVGYMGGNYYETPHIDRLKQSGINFSNGYAGAANSAPSRACLLTGLYPPRHGIYTVNSSERGKEEDRKMIPVPNRTLLDPSFVTLPQLLKQTGYQTCHIGKWHMSTDPTNYGMDTNIAGNHAGNPRTYFSPYGNPDLPDREVGEYLMDRLADEAVHYLDTVNKETPFFLYYATYAVHTPLQAKEDMINKYRNKPATSAHNNPVYAAMIENMDLCIGKVMDALQKNNLLENTFIIFTSDNGGVYDISRQWPLRAGKGSFYEGGIRVPFIIYQKGLYEGGVQIDQPVSQLDILPTLVDIVSFPAPFQPDGKSLLPLLNHHETDPFKERALFWHFPAYLEGGNSESRDPVFRTRPVSVIRKGDWKLIEHYEENALELFNLAKDVGEKEELSQSFPEIRDQLYNELNRWKQTTQALLPVFKE